MSNDYILGIDIGTGSCKIEAFTPEGVSVGKATCSYPLYRGENGIVEQEAEDYWKATITALGQLFSANPEIKGKIRGIGLTGQTPSEIFVDRQGLPLRQVITWQDTRAIVEADLIRAKYSEGQLFDILGSNVPVSPNWTSSRLMWVARNEPNIAARCYKILQPKDYIGLKLTGNYQSDSWTFKSLVHLKTFTTNESYLNFLGFSSNHLPKIAHWNELRGTVSQRAAKLTGLPAGIPVSTGLSDAPATMLGSGVFEKPSLAFNCSGTSEIVGISTEKEQYTKGLMTVPPYITGTLSILYGPTQGGGNSLFWLKNNVTSQSDFNVLIQEASSVAAGSEGLLFIPYLSGERAPIWNAKAKGAFLNLTSMHDRRHFARAVMKGVAFSVRHCLEVARKADKQVLKTLRITGGGSRIPLWCKIKCDVCGLPVEILECEDSTALGAAMTAAVGTGLFPDLRSASASMVRVVNRLDPDDKNHRLYNELFTQYLEASSLWLD
ncbi:MAG: hypothetical protein GX303_03480 [Clostridiales bacterium]|nr:hypothetical protein [Clostridiales bacterium]